MPSGLTGPDLSAGGVFDNRVHIGRNPDAQTDDTVMQSAVPEKRSRHQALKRPLPHMPARLTPREICGMTPQLPQTSHADPKEPRLSCNERCCLGNFVPRPQPFASRKPTSAGRAANLLFYCFSTVLFQYLLFCYLLLYCLHATTFHLENPPVHVEPQSKPQSLHLENPPVHVEPQNCMMSQGIPRCCCRIAMAGSGAVGKGAAWGEASTGI